MSLIHFILFFPPTILGSYYVGTKILKELSLQNKKQKKIFWIFIFLVNLIFLFTYSSPLAFLLYSCIFFLTFDLLLFLIKKTHFKKGETVLNKVYFHGILIFFLAFLFTLFGLYNANSPIIKEISISIQKELQEPLDIALITDLHLGTGTDKNTIDRIVKEVNQEDVDLLVLVGDIFDEHTMAYLKDYTYQKLKEIKTTYGSYYVEGNHDLLTNEVREKLEENNITVLEDETLLVNKQFYLIGRKDKNHDRKSLVELTQNIDFHYPVLLLNHRPDDLKHAQELGIDLQLSGHTHAGQLFPANFVLIHDYHQFDQFHLIVSPGYGNWGIPIRTYGHNELIIVHLNGINKKDS